VGHEHICQGQTILDRICKFFLGVRDLIPFDVYIVDFVLIGPEVKIIEINPFGPMTGSSLFSWSSERVLLQGGIDHWGDLPTNAQNSTFEDALSKSDSLSSNFTFNQFFASVPTENGWRTVFRVLSSPPPKVDQEYIDIVFGDLLKFQEEPEDETTSCSVC